MGEGWKRAVAAAKATRRKDIDMPDTTETLIADLADQETISETAARHLARELALPSHVKAGARRGLAFGSLLRLGGILAALVKKILAAVAAGAAMMVFKVAGKRLAVAVFELDVVDTAGVAELVTSTGGYSVTARKA